MTILIENADNTVLEMLEFLKKERKIDFKIREEEPYSKSMVRSLLRERKPISTPKYIPRCSSFFSLFSSFSSDIY